MCGCAKVVESIGLVRQAARPLPRPPKGRTASRSRWRRKLPRGAGPISKPNAPLAGRWASTSSATMIPAIPCGRGPKVRRSATCRVVVDGTSLRRLSDRRHPRHRRLARHRDGRNRPVGGARVIRARPRQTIQYRTEVEPLRSLLTARPSLRFQTGSLRLQYDIPCWGGWPCRRCYP